MELRTLEGGEKLYTHEAQQCFGQDVCVIHKPSDHSMRGFPQHWRGDRRLMERICPHGVGHPDPDHLWFVEYMLGEQAADVEEVHGCDGCCK